MPTDKHSGNSSQCIVSSILRTLSVIENRSLEQSTGVLVVPDDEFVSSSFEAQSKTVAAVPEHQRVLLLVQELEAQDAQLGHVLSTCGREVLQGLRHDPDALQLEIIIVLVLSIFNQVREEILAEGRLERVAFILADFCDNFSCLCEHGVIKPSFFFIVIFVFLKTVNFFAECLRDHTDKTGQDRFGGFILALHDFHQTFVDLLDHSDIFVFQNRALELRPDVLVEHFGCIAVVFQVGHE